MGIARGSFGSFIVILWVRFPCTQSCFRAQVAPGQVRGQEPNLHPLAFVSLERASYSGRVLSLACQGHGGTQGSQSGPPSRWPRPKRSARSGFCPHPPARIPRKLSGSRGPAARALPPGAREQEVAFPGGQRLGKLGTNAGPRPGLPGPPVRCGLQYPELANFTRRDAACARGVRHSEPIPLLPSPTP